MTTAQDAALDLTLTIPRQRVAEVATPQRNTWRRNYPAALVLTDLVCAFLGAGLTAAMAHTIGTAPLTDEHNRILGMIALPMWMLVLALSGGYDLRVLGVGSDEFKRVVNAGVRFGATMALIAYLSRVIIARGILVVALPLTVALTCVMRYAVRRVLHRVRAQGKACDKVLVVGTGEHAITLVRELKSAPHLGLDVLGVCMPGGRREDSLGGLDIPIFGSIGSVRTAAIRAGANTVAVAQSPAITPGVMRRLAWELEGLDIDLVVAPGLTDVAGPRIHVRPVPGVPLLHIEQPQFSGFGRVTKGAIDRTLAAIMLTLMAPFLAVLAIAIRLDSEGPSLFRQQRVGRDGRIFTVYKFRSMCQDAETKLERIIDLNECTDSLLFKVKDDPRVTRVGKFLRRYSLDELPQLLNVLFGQMSLVGPRPPLPSEVQRYDGTINRRLLVKPGLTGLWQVSGRSDLDWEDGLRLDLYYVENWSPALDFMILWKTAFAVVRARGAY